MYTCRVHSFFHRSLFVSTSFSFFFLIRLASPPPSPIGRDVRWSKISDAVNDGVVVFQRRGASDANAAAAPPAAAGGGRRARANTDDTVDSDEEYVELRFARGHEVEMTTTTAPTTMNTTATSVDLLGSTTAAAAVRRDDDFTITDATSDEDDFVGSPTAPPKPGARGDTEDIPPPRP